MSKSKPLRDAVKSKFYPFARERGFIRGKANSLEVPFQRKSDSTFDWFEIQWEKYHRPAFVIHFDQYPLDSEFFVGNDGSQCLSSEDLPGSAGSLKRWKDGSLRTWFQLRRPWKQTFMSFKWAYSPDEVVTHVISAFDELERWWETKEEGPHIYLPYGYPPQPLSSRP
ncbi:MAG: hypothetical protein ABJN26_14155 [Stappiaceae bacterium]